MLHVSVLWKSKAQLVEPPPEEEEEGHLAIPEADPGEVLDLYEPPFWPWLPSRVTREKYVQALLQKNELNVNKTFKARNIETNEM